MQPHWSLLEVACELEGAFRKGPVTSFAHILHYFGNTVSPSLRSHTVSRRPDPNLHFSDTHHRAQTGHHGTRPVVSKTHTKRSASPWPTDSHSLANRFQRGCSNCTFVADWPTVRMHAGTRAEYAAHMLLGGARAEHDCPTIPAHDTHPHRAKAGRGTPAPECCTHPDPRCALLTAALHLLHHGCG